MTEGNEKLCFSVLYYQSISAGKLPESICSGWGKTLIKYPNDNINEETITFKLSFFIVFIKIKSNKRLSGAVDKYNNNDKSSISVKTNTAGTYVYYFN